MTSSPKIKVLVVDDHPMVRSGLIMILDSEPGLEPIGEAKTGVEAIAAILQDFPNAHITIFTSYDGDENIYQGLQTGAKGYLLKTAERAELLGAIRTVHARQNYVSTSVGAKLASRMNSPQLSKREIEVLKLLAKGNGTQAISAALYVSEGTVKFHITNILHKLDVSDRTQAVVAAYQRGIVDI
ncbi:response regulator transcription factor [Pleurocapsa sp. FMAR1]|uniref:response regulator transcription factor n=1 Tax=Pleurocapsa sp. FMAR1 TaxID=3040204 RepID=UPI0029C937DE|nr:response regulator transcription factor [Pleurocapsa sp. FMAR1]